MDLYLNPSKITEIIGVEEGIINRTLERQDVDIEPYLRIVSVPSDTPGDLPKPKIQLRIDGLALLIKKLTYNIPTDDIIENLSCQIFQITYLQETCKKLEEDNQTLIAENTELRETLEAEHEAFLDEHTRIKEEFAEESRTLTAENGQLREKIGAFQVEKAHLVAKVQDLRSQLEAEQSKNWVTRLLKR